MWPKTALLALVVALLYVLAVVVGQRGGLPGLVPSRETAEDLRGRWFAPRSVEATDLKATCSRQDRRLEFTGNCTLEISESGDGSRALRLSTQSAVSFDYRPRGDDAVGMRFDLDPASPTELVVPKEGARLLLSCNRADDCVVVLE
ncbi:MAG: hypothetical protein DIU78_018405 [Pseudomonadota bacterium]